MAWYNPFTWSIATGGIDLDAEAERTRALNDKKAEQDANAYRRGIWTEADLAFVEAQRVADATAWNPDRFNAEVTAAAAEGAREGLVDMQGAVKDTLTSAAGWTLRGVFGFVPWWIWIAGALYAAWHFGLLKNALRRA